MKNVIILIMALVCLSCGRHNNTKQEQAEEKACPTKKDFNYLVPELNDSDYEVVIAHGRDTSCYCFNLTHDGQGKYIETRIFRRAENYYKRRIPYTVPTYKQLISQIGECLHTLGKTNNLCTVNGITLETKYLGDAAVDMTNIYDTHFTDSSEAKNENILWSLKQAGLLNDMNRVLKRYGLECDSLFCRDPFVTRIDKAAFMETSSLSHKGEVPQRGVFSMSIGIAFKKLNR